MTRRPQLRTTADGRAIPDPPPPRPPADRLETVGGFPRSRRADRNVSRRSADRRVVFREVLKVVALLALILGGYVWTIQNQRAGCERAKLDRTANAEGWRTAEDARRAAGETRTADRYARIATGLEERSRIVCADAFPYLP